MLIAMNHKQRVLVQRERDKAIIILNFLFNEQPDHYFNYMQFREIYFDCKWILTAYV